MLPKKHLSGCEKRKRKRQQDESVQSQKGAIHNFFSPSSSVVPHDNPVDAAPNIEEAEQEQQQVDDNLREQVDATEN